MKKVVQELDDFDEYYDPDDFDLKMEYLNWRSRKNHESTDIWIYLGADIVDGTFAKIGLTMGNLTTRSYSSSRPTYYLFCAFKCRPELSKADLAHIERDVLARIDSWHRNADGSSKRLIHYDSGKISECFSPVNFLNFYVDLHYLLYHHHYAKFLTIELCNIHGEYDGNILECLFSNRISAFDQSRYRRMIIQT